MRLPGSVLAVLAMCHDYMDQRADISHETNDDGAPLPNEEMTLLTELQIVLERYET